MGINTPHFIRKVSRGSSEKDLRILVPRDQAEEFRGKWVLVMVLPLDFILASDIPAPKNLGPSFVVRPGEVKRRVKHGVES